MQAGCSYATDDMRAKGSANGGPDNVGDRIHRLEALVSSLVKGNRSSQPPGELSYVSPASDSDGYPAVESALEASTPYGAMAATSENSHFVGESHWEAVLRDVSDSARCTPTSSSLAKA